MNTKKLVLTALMVAMFSGSAAFAGPGGKDNGNGRGASDNGRNSNGAIASELKWRNAGHASAQAFENANANSAVGILATLKDAATASADAYELAGVRDPRDIQGDIDTTSADILWMESEDGFDPTSQEYNDLLGDLATYEAELIAANVVSEDAEMIIILAEEEEAAQDVGLDDLSEEAITALWDLLENK